MGTIYFVGHYFYRAVSEMDKIANGFTGAVSPTAALSRNVPVCERMKFPRDGRAERDRNSKNERLLASTETAAACRGSILLPSDLSYVIKLSVRTKNQVADYPNPFQ